MNSRTEQMMQEEDPQDKTSTTKKDDAIVGIQTPAKSPNPKSQVQNSTHNTQSQQQQQQRQNLSQRQESAAAASQRQNLSQRQEAVAAAPPAGEDQQSPGASFADFQKPDDSKEEAKQDDEKKDADSHELYGSEGEEDENLIDEQVIEAMTSSPAKDENGIATQKLSQRLSQKAVKEKGKGEGPSQDDYLKYNRPHDSQNDKKMAAQQTAAASKPLQARDMNRPPPPQGHHQINTCASNTMPNRFNPNSMGFSNNQSNSRFPPKNQPNNGFKGRIGPQNERKQQLRGGPQPINNVPPPGVQNTDIISSKMNQDGAFQSQLIERLLEQNDQMQKSVREMAEKVSSSLQTLAGQFAPLLEGERKENQKLKRLLRERTDLRNDDDILRAEIGGGAATQPPQRNSFQDYNMPYKRQRVEQKPFNQPQIVNHQNRPNPHNYQHQQRVAAQHSQKSEMDAEAARMSPDDHLAQRPSFKINDSKVGAGGHSKAAAQHHNDDDFDNRPFEQTAEGSRLQTGFDEPSFAQSGTTIAPPADTTGSSGFMIGNNKLQISTDKLKAAEALMKQFNADQNDFEEEDPASYLKKNNKRFQDSSSKPPPPPHVTAPALNQFPNTSTSDKENNQQAAC